MLNIHDLSLDTRNGFIRSLDDFLPRPTWRDFCLWGLSESNPNNSKFAGLLGLPQLAALTVHLLSDCVPPDDADTLTLHSIPLSTYLTFEVISDNLAIGLAHRDSSDRTFEARRELLRRFNQAMINQLSGTPQPSPLEAELPLAVQISAFERSLSPEKYHAFAGAYLKMQPDTGITSDDLEFTVWDGLVANLQSASALMNNLNGSAVYEYVRQGLLRRYQAVSVLLEDDHQPLAQQLQLGGDTILVVPTLAYYIGVLGEHIYRIPHFAKVVGDNTFHAALQKAALLVRMTNDLGTHLLLDPDEYRNNLVKQLRVIYRHEPECYPNLRALIGAAAPKFNPVLTRLEKDVQSGEFNLLLNGTDTMDVTDALTYMNQSLHEFARQYQYQRLELSYLCILLEHRFQLPELVRPIMRFVEFHEMLYSRAYKTPEGEYAV